MDSCIEPSNHTTSNHPMLSRCHVRLVERTLPKCGRWASPVACKLATASGRIEFVILRSGCSSPVALHLASRQRNYLRLRIGTSIREKLTSSCLNTLSIAQTGSVDPLSCCDAADGAFAANPAGRGPEGRGLWRSSSMYVPIHNPRFAPTAPWPSVNHNL